jgi:hypothetical protein
MVKDTIQANHRVIRIARTVRLESMQMSKRPPTRRSVDLSGYPDLVVVYLGYRANAPRGLLTIMLLQEFFLLGPFHVGFRQYWTDFAHLKTFTVTGQHATWWASMGKDTKGGGFWHETYCKSGGIEALYIDMPPLGLGRFAPELDPVGPFMTSAQRLARPDVGRSENERPDAAPN